MKTLILLSCVVFLQSNLAVAADVAPKPKNEGNPQEKSKKPAPKMNFQIQKFDAIPNAELKAAKPAEDAQTAPNAKRAQDGYTVEGVIHGKGFIRTPAGAVASAPFTQVKITKGNPFQTEKFSTIVRVKNAAKKTAQIELAILDARGDTVMEAKGTLAFKTETAEWTVDWDPTNVRGPGEYQVLVRVDGNPSGPFPLKFVE
jgi:hypothetical protein